MVGCCEHRDEPSVYVKCVECLDLLRKYCRILGSLFDSSYVN
jgi:hypothetical protein